MDITTTTGLAGQLVAYVEQGTDPDPYGFAVIARAGFGVDDPRRFCTVILAQRANGLAAMWGQYELTREEAMADFGKVVLTSASR